MEQPEHDSTYKLQRATSFNGRVEPIWTHYRKTTGQRGVIGAFMEKRRLKNLITGIREVLQSQSAPEVPWDRDDGESVCSIKVAKLGVLNELRAVVTPAFRPPARIPHFAKFREWNSYCLPVDFSKPFEVGTKERIPILSSVRLKEELDLIAQVLHFGSRMHAEKMVAFLDMKESDIVKAEKEADNISAFWTLFGYAVLKRLVDTSVEKTLPIVFA